MMLSLVNSKIAGAVPTVSWCKSLNQNQQTAREWQAAHFSTVRAAQMRAEVLIGDAHELSCASLCDDSALRKEAIRSSITADMLTARDDVLRARMLN
jgi:hypothetical protein